MDDRRDPVRGRSTASTAMIQHEIDVPLHQLARMIGDENGHNRYHSNRLQGLLRLVHPTKSAWTRIRGPIARRRGRDDLLPTARSLHVLRQMSSSTGTNRAITHFPT